MTEPQSPQKQKHWVKRHPIVTGILIFIVLAVVAGSNNPQVKNETKEPQKEQ